MKIIEEEDDSLKVLEQGKCIFERKKFEVNKKNRGKRKDL